MVKLTLLFRHPVDVAAFEARYPACLILLEKMPGIRRRQACTVLGSPGGASPYYRLLEFYFDDFAALDVGLTSAEGRAAGADLVSFAGHNVEMIFADVFEE